MQRNDNGEEIDSFNVKALDEYKINSVFELSSSLNSMNASNLLVIQT